MRRVRGFTLIELIITVVIFAIVVGFAIPSFRGLLQSNRSVSQANEMLTGLQLARSEAVRRGQMVTVCASANTTTADEEDVACSGDADGWTTGWIVFVDEVGSTPGVREAGEELVNTFPPLTGDATITADDAFVRFTATGTHASGAAEFSHSVPDDSGGVRDICVYPTGRSEVESGCTVN